MGFPHRLIYVAIASGATPNVIGPTGCGKTQGLLAIGTQWMDIRAEDIHVLYGASQDPITLGSGYPSPNEDGVTFSSRVDERLYQVGIKKKAMVFWDETPDADRDQMNAMSPILLTRMLNGVRMECVMVCAGNRPRDGSNELNKKLASRLLHIPVHRDRAQQVQALRNGWDNVMGKPPRIPENWVDLIDGKKRLVGDFLDQHPDALPDEDAHIDPEFPASPNMRSWEEFAVRFMACAEAAQLSKKETQMGIEGCVGRGLGAQFSMWSRHGGLNVREFIDNPNKLKELKDASPDKIDSLFDAVGAYTAEGSVTGEQYGAFAASALKHGFTPDLVLRHARAVSGKLPRAVRDAVFNEIAVRKGGN